MKFLLFKILLQRRVRDEGFTLPLVVALGLIMMLLSAVHVVQSGDENLTSLSSKSSSQALAMAEVGVAKYRELINRNRVLAVHNNSNWSNVQTQACDANINTKANTAQWHTINDGSGNIGAYRLVSYVYDNDGNPATDENGQLDLSSDAANDIDGDDQSDSRGILTVEGKTSDASTTEGDGIARIQVEIPIGINTSDQATGVIGDLESLVPALWLQQSPAVMDNTKIGNLIIDGNRNGVADGNLADGNIVLYGCDDTVNLANNNTIGDPRTLPPIATITAQKDAAVAANQHNDQSATIDQDTRLADGTAKFFPNPPSLPCDVETTDCRYYYVRNGNLTITNADVLVDGKVKVILYIINGNLTINGQVNLVNSSDFTLSAFNSSTPPSFLGNLKPGWTTTSASSRFLEIHVIRTNPADTNVGNVTINGNVNIKGLINAPNGTVTINGGSTVNIVGSVWANNWNNSGGATVTIIPDDYKFYNLTLLRTPKPITYAPREWETLEAQ